MLSHRQEVGRGLRLSVDQYGECVVHEAIVHDIGSNILFCPIPINVKKHHENLHYKSAKIQRTVDMDNQ